MKKTRSVGGKNTLCSSTVVRAEKRRILNGRERAQLFVKVNAVSQLPISCSVGQGSMTLSGESALGYEE